MMISVTETQKIVENNKKIKKQTAVKCIDCSVTLGTVIETDGPAKDQKHVFRCPCGGESFTVKTSSPSYFLSDEKYEVENLERHQSDWGKFIYTLRNYNGTDNIHNAQ